MDKQQQALVELSAAELAEVNGGQPGAGPDGGMCDDLMGLIKDVITNPGA